MVDGLKEFVHIFNASHESVAASSRHFVNCSIFEEKGVDYYYQKKKSQEDCL